MKLFLQISLTGWQRGEFGNMFLNYASSLSGNVMGTDLDSQSEPMIAGMVLRLIEQSRSIFLFVVATDPNLPIGAAQKVFSKLQESHAKVRNIVICGDHRTAESMLSVFDKEMIRESNPEKIKTLIRGFSDEG